MRLSHHKRTRWETREAAVAVGVISSARMVSGGRIVYKLTRGELLTKFINKNNPNEER